MEEIHKLENLLHDAREQEEDRQEIENLRNLLQQAELDKNNFQEQNQNQKQEIERLQTELNTMKQEKEEKEESVLAETYNLAEIDIVTKARILLDTEEQYVGIILEYTSEYNSRCQWALRNQGVCNGLRKIFTDSVDAKFSSTFKASTKHQFITFFFVVRNESPRIKKIAYLSHFLARVFSGLPNEDFVVVTEFMKDVGKIAHLNRKENILDPDRNKLKAKDLMPTVVKINSALYEWIDQEFSKKWKNRFDNLKF